MRGSFVMCVAGCAMMLLSSLAWAQVGTGNFRRREAIKKAFRMDGRHYNRWVRDFKVVGLDSVLNHSAKGHSVRAKLPADSRILAVINRNNGLVRLVEAPKDRNKPCRLVATRRANRMGLVTQRQARTQALYNGGKHGKKGQVRVSDNGLTPFGYSYAFKQTSDLKTVTSTRHHRRTQQHLVTIDRSVPITGQPGETAQSGRQWTALGTKMRYARKYEGISQAEMARSLGVSARTLSKWERNLVPVPENKLPAVLKHLGHRL